MKKTAAISLIFSCILWILAPAGRAAGEGSSIPESRSKISFDLKGMDVVEAIKILAAKGNYNVILGNNIQGRATMFLKDVDVDDAFEIIIQANNLAIDKKGDVTYIMTQREYEALYGERYGANRQMRVFQLKYAKAPEVAKVLDQVRTKIGKSVVDRDSNSIIMIDSPSVIRDTEALVAKLDMPTVTKVFELDYAAVKDLKDRIQEALTKDFGTMRTDERTNKIIVTDLEPKVREIEEIIKNFDSQPRQVLIEAEIVEITLDDKFKYGVDWQGVMKTLHQNFNLVNAFKIAAQGALIPGAELTIGLIGTTDKEVIVQILKTVGDTNTLSSPRVMAVNNHEAKILVGSSSPYATNTVTQGTSTTTTGTALSFLDIGVKLFVTPTINKDGFITVKLRPEVSSQSGTYTYGDPATTVPIVSTTQAETTVMLKDGTTIVIGGLISDSRVGVKNEVPFLGDIPVIGLAFKNTNNEIVKKELVIFITPHIVSGEAEFINQPMSYPMGEKKFTMTEWPTFDRRYPRAMSPGYLDAHALKVMPDRVNTKSMTEAEYYMLVRNEVAEAMRIPEDEKARLAKGTKAKVAFILYSGGGLMMKPQLIDSTDNTFGMRLMEAVTMAAPFPPLPVSVKSPTKRFVVEMLYDPKGKK